tara:strand:+ start:909 stop:1541 length:633 start_codon:yes stop_codon:yes gene_type:complete
MRKIFLFLAFALSSIAGNWTQARESTVSVQLKVPDGGWKIRIDQVYQTPTHLLAVSKLERSPGLAIQVISQAKDSVQVKAPKLPIRHYVLGKTWNWPNKVPYAFLSDPKEITKKVAGAKLVFQAKAKPAPKAPKKINYIVVYKKEVFTDGKNKQGETLEQLAKRHCKELSASPPSVLRIINGFAAQFPSGNVPKLKTLPEVKYIEMDQAF